MSTDPIPPNVEGIDADWVRDTAHAADVPCLACGKPFHTPDKRSVRHCDPCREALENGEHPLDAETAQTVCPICNKGGFKNGKGLRVHLGRTHKAKPADHIPDGPSLGFEKYRDVVPKYLKEKGLPSLQTMVEPIEMGPEFGWDDETP